MTIKKKTSKRLATIAGSMLHKAKLGLRGEYKYVFYADHVLWRDIKALAASVLSQTEPEKKAKKRGKK